MLEGLFGFWWFLFYLNWQQFQCSLV